MKPFSLHAVKKFRHQLETRALQDLVQATAVERQLRDVLEETEHELNELYAALQQDKEQGTSVDRLIMFDQRIDWVKEQVRQRRKAVEKQQGQVAKQRQRLLKASKDRKIIEKLEEQQNAAYKKYLDKQEAGMLDEIAVLSHERQKSE